ncbi:hypothetical protein BpHYR1_035433, partial [Brachionus plicatilis]
MFQRPQALAFIPPEDVIDRFNAAKAKVSNEVLEFYDYVQSTFTGKKETGIRIFLTTEDNFGSGFRQALLGT